MTPEHLEKAFDRLADFDSVVFPTTWSAGGWRGGEEVAAAIRNLALSAGLTDELREVLYRRSGDGARAVDEVLGVGAFTFENAFTHGLLIGAIVALTAEQLAHE
jgi:hypothetical protein